MGNRPTTYNQGNSRKISKGGYKIEMTKPITWKEMLPVMARAVMIGIEFVIERRGFKVDPDAKRPGQEDFEWGYVMWRKPSPEDPPSWVASLKEPERRMYIVWESKCIGDRAAMRFPAGVAVAKFWEF